VSLPAAAHCQIESAPRVGGRFHPYRCDQVIALQDGQTPLQCLRRQRLAIVGGIVFFIVERYIKNHRPVVHDVADVSYRTAFTIGLVQCLSMIPGVSRSGATIVGGLLCRMDRTAAAEFSFLLALPTMLAATCYDVYKNASAFQGSDWGNLLIGFVVSFLFSIVGIKLLVRFVANHTFIPFGIYRIIAGVLFLLLVIR
jgi:undecaprenyl-diphosphatase